MTRALIALALLLTVAGLASAADFGNIEPGVTTTEQVREYYGRASKEVPAKVEGYDTLQWVYERSQAPEGLVRMTVDFGLLTPSGYKPTVARLLTLEPKPSIFSKKVVIDGWGLPDGEGSRDGVQNFFYREGLLVIFDKEGDNAVRLIFSIPQPDSRLAPPTAPAAPAAPPKQ
jgi:hypothetical protein